MTRGDKLTTQRRRHRSLAVISGPGVPSLEEDGRNPVEPAHSHRPSFGGDYPAAHMLLHGTDGRASVDRKVFSATSMNSTDVVSQSRFSSVRIESSVVCTVYDSVNVCRYLTITGGGNVEPAD